MPTFALTNNKKGKKRKCCYCYKKLKKEKNETMVIFFLSNCYIEKVLPVGARLV